LLQLRSTFARLERFLRWLSIPMLFWRGKVLDSRRAFARSGQLDKLLTDSDEQRVIASV